MTARNCTRCGELLLAESFYFVSRKTGTLRGQCKECLREIRIEQRDPSWLPTCARCGEKRPRKGPGRRLCNQCFDSLYDKEQRSNGSHRAKLKDCRQCGARRLRGDHVPNAVLCPICRSVPQHRRKGLKHFNITPPEYLALLAFQGHACGICRRFFNKQRPPHIDHRHGAPRLVRGALCVSCNMLLSLARDSEGTLRAAASFLESPPAQALFPGRESHVEANRPGARWNKLTRART